MVLREGLLLAGIGLGFGVLASFALTRLLASMLFGISPADPFTYVVVSLILTGVALLASFVPARRATRVDPIQALRRLRSAGGSFLVRLLSSVMCAALGQFIGETGVFCLFAFCRPGKFLRRNTDLIHDADSMPGALRQTERPLSRIL